MVKKLLRNYIIDTSTLYAASLIATGMSFNEGVKTILLAGLGVTIALKLVKPIINILLLPINLITFNLFKWISSSIAFYLVTLVVPGFIISGFYFAGIQTSWFDIPTLNFSGVLAYVAYSFTLSIISSVIYWLIS